MEIKFEGHVGMLRGNGRGMQVAREGGGVNVELSPGRNLCGRDFGRRRVWFFRSLCLALPCADRYGKCMSIGFKEWTLVCDALGRGAQSIIIRKGGIAEGRAGFRFEHPEFFLFPTLFHEQAAKLKVPPDTALPAPRADGQHEIALRVRVEWTRDVADLAIAKRLAPFHIWQDSEIEKRFQYELPAAKRAGGENAGLGVSVAFVRVEKLSAAFLFPDSPKFGGCRSWIRLPDLPAGVTGVPVIEESVHRARESEIRALLG